LVTGSEYRVSRHPLSQGIVNVQHYFGKKFFKLSAIWDCNFYVCKKTLWPACIGVSVQIRVECLPSPNVRVVARNRSKDDLKWLWDNGTVQL
jgi:hypothetical protein